MDFRSSLAVLYSPDSENPNVAALISLSVQRDKIVLVSIPPLKKFQIFHLELSPMFSF